MKKIFAIIASLTLLFAANAHAYKSKKSMLNIDTIVYSEFSSKEQQSFDWDLEEQTYGIGVSYLGRPSHSKNHWFGIGAEFYDDQYSNAAYQLNGLYKFRLPVEYIIDGIEFNFKVGLVNRFYREISHPLPNLTIYEEERETRFAATPSVTVAITKNFTTEVIYLPEDWGENITDGYEMWLVKVGLRF